MRFDVQPLPKRLVVIEGAVLLIVLAVLVPIGIRLSATITSWWSDADRSDSQERHKGTITIRPVRQFAVLSESDLTTGNLPEAIDGIESVHDAVGRVALETLDSGAVVTDQVAVMTDLECFWVLPVPVQQGHLLANAEAGSAVTLILSPSNVRNGVDSGTEAPATVLHASVGTPVTAVTLAVSCSARSQVLEALGSSSVFLAHRTTVAN